MGRSNRLNSVARYKESLERKAAEQLGAANQNLRVHQDTLSTLDEHRDSYRQMLSNTHETGVSATTWRQNLHFLQALDGAIEQQIGQVANQTVQSDIARASWRESHQSTQAVTRLQNRLAQQQSKSEAAAESQLAQENWQSRRAVTQRRTQP